MAHPENPPIGAKISCASRFIAHFVKAGALARRGRCVSASYIRVMRTTAHEDVRPPGRPRRPTSGLQVVTVAE